MMNEYLEDKLILFLQASRVPFSLQTLIKYLGEPSSILSADELSSYLIYNQLAYLNPTFDGKGDMWISRAGLYTGKTLVVIPTQEEIASGILIPGSRFLPFYDPVLLPNELVFTWKGTPLPTKLYARDPQDIYPYYGLFGDEYSPQYLALDNEENEDLYHDVDYEDPVEVKVTVIDMGSIYWNAGFKPGDRIVAKLDDWIDGVFELGILPATQVDLGKEAAWRSEMEDCLIHSFELAGPGACIEEQISYAYFLGHETLFTPHASSLEEMLRVSKRIGIEPYGVETRLWFADTEIPAKGSWNMNYIRSPASLVEDAIIHLGIPVSLEVVDSYILDALFRKETGAEEMLERVIPSVRPGAAFCNPVIEKYAATRFEDLAQDYNIFTDQEIGELRNRYVELHMGLSSFVSDLQQTGLDPDEIPEQGAVVLGQLMTHTVTALENIDFGDEDKPVDLDSLWLSVEGMEESFFDTKTAIQEALPELSKRRFSILRDELPEEEDHPDA